MHATAADLRGLWTILGRSGNGSGQQLAAGAGECRACLARGLPTAAARRTHGEGPRISCRLPLQQAVLQFTAPPARCVHLGALPETSLMPALNCSISAVGPPAVDLMHRLQWAVQVAVAVQPGAFATRARYGMAVGGLLYMNATNAVKAGRAFALFAPPKAKMA